ncbi:integrase arm-type DNA-binding domain-containing protein [Mariprofundus sp. KV]|uniref:tyrosine-type recombinase/integrase n=1 Tax=Mariprofundus sp. KV TaxID=2608715 RepID=UPI0015A409C3|nr:integrase arm-type DNA-binding domain-containing protein [Mariprofundus sp. KV]NWF36998.1 tyrosine-type recombinase/integrase [Mariprofundus sp. KV]
MALSDAKVKAASVPEGKKQVKLSDGSGMYLHVSGSGKYWRMNYRFAGKQKTLSLGVYPTVTLKEARKRRSDAHKLLDKNIDPSQAKKKAKRQAATEHNASTFEMVARELVKKNRVNWSSGYARSVESRLEKHVFPWLGSMKIAEIEAPDVLGVLRRVESYGKIETVHRLKMLCGQIFRYAIATGLIKSDPSRDLKGALEPLVSTHRATITDSKKVGELLRAIESFEGTFVVKCALRLTPYVFLRPGELRKAEWSEIDLDRCEWRIPAQKMKMRVEHIVPLSRQAVAIFQEVHEYTGSGKFVFPSIRNVHRPMSENTINACLRRIGYTKDEICAHGFRAMASTLLHEQGWNSDVIERQLAHKEGNAIKGAYNHARHLPERREMMQSWADYLGALKEGANIIPIHRIVS